MDKDKIYRLEIDLEFNNTKRISQTNEINCVKYAQHYALLYEYRNSLVHGFKDPGHPIEIDSYGSSPYYDSQDSEYWELIYPTTFFKYISENCLGMLNNYLAENNINPYAIYEKLGVFDEIWASPKKLKSKFGTIKILNKIKWMSNRLINYMKSKVYNTTIKF